MLVKMQLINIVLAMTLLIAKCGSFNLQTNRKRKTVMLLLKDSVLQSHCLHIFNSNARVVLFLSSYKLRFNLSAADSNEL